MKIQEKGIGKGSQIIFYSPSEFAKDNLYYPECAGHFYCYDGYDVNRRNYDNILIMTVISGKCFIKTSGDWCIASKGDTIVLNCNEPHNYRCTFPMETQWIHINGADSKKLAKKIPLIVKNSVKRINPLLESVLASLLNPKIENELSYSLIIYEILLNLLLRKTDSGNKASDIAVDSAKIYIQNNIDTTLSVEDISKKVNLSASHFSKIFKEKTGFSPYDYVLKARLRIAKNLLLTTDETISEIATQVGFNSDANFIYFFKNNEGLSPHKFRKLNF